MRHESGRRDLEDQNPVTVNELAPQRLLEVRCGTGLTVACTSIPPTWQNRMRGDDPAPMKIYADKGIRRRASTARGWPSDGSLRSPSPRWARSSISRSCHAERWRQLFANMYADYDFAVRTDEEASPTGSPRCMIEPIYRWALRNTLADRPDYPHAENHGAAYPSGDRPKKALYVNSGSPVTSSASQGRGAARY